ncbi:MAG: hypothetical protein M0Z52_10945 [Actinomycetota bacterium]|nr:hypothetical protein [Actinomycetota bacterium]
MPHFGLIDEEKLGPIQGPLMRSRLHIRGGRRRIISGDIANGILALYDALTSAMDFYLASHQELRDRLIGAGEDILSDRNLFLAFQKNGIIPDNFEWQELDFAVQLALGRNMGNYNWRKLAGKLEECYIRLEAAPFDEGALPAPQPEPFLPGKTA